MPRVFRSSLHRSATLADVARRAGVSARAASAVLNQARAPGRISPAMRERILAAATRLEYGPNAATPSRVKRRLQTVGVVTVVEGGELNDYFLEVFSGIVAAATWCGQHTTVFTLTSWRAGVRRLHELCDGRVDGLILLAPTLVGRTPPLPKHPPFVSIHANRELAGAMNIESDEEGGACALVRHLVNWGHTRIMHLSGPAGFVGAERRISGYRRGLAEEGLPADPALQVQAGYTTPEGRDAMTAWLRQNAGRPLPHAVFCANDAAAIGCLEALAGAGLRVPDDVSVAGFDDTCIARAFVPQLTSVRQPLREMGARAVDLLLAQIKEQPADSTAVAPLVFPVELVSRGSVGPRTPVELLVPPCGTRPGAARHGGLRRLPQLRFNVSA